MQVVETYQMNSDSDINASILNTLPLFLITCLVLHIEFL